MATNPPVMRHREWRFLLRDFVSTHSFLGVVPSNVLQFGLAPVASVARWLIMEQPGLLERETLTLLIPGASDVECADDGRWFAFLPWMLGRPEMTIQVHLVGRELISPYRPRSASHSSRETNATPAARLVQRFPAAELYHGTLGQWRSSDAAVAADACILFSPGFSEHYKEWFAPGELADYMAALPLGLFSYSTLDFLEDLAVLKMLGFKFEAREQGVNPWALEHEHREAVGSFGSYQWGLVNVEAPAEVALDCAELTEFIELQQLLREDSEQWGPDVAMRRLCTPLDVENESTSDEIYLMPENFAVLKSSGLVGRLDDVGFMQVSPDLLLPPDVMAARPKRNELDMVLWALRAYRDHVQPLMVAEGAAEALLGGGASMEDMLGDFAKMATGDDMDGQDLMRQIRLSGGIHGPTHPCWGDLLESLGWGPDDYVDDPTRLEPAFWVTGAKYAKAGLPVVCEAYAYFPDDAEDELANEAMEELELMYPDGVLLGFKSMPFKEINGHKYSFGGLLFWNGAWHPFALTPDMKSIDAVIEQIQSGFSFENVNPKYADDATLLAVPFNRMCYGRNPNEPGPMMGLTQGTGWVTLMPA